MIRTCVLYLLVVLSVIIGASEASAAGTASAVPVNGTPVTFLRNEGQWPSEILYQSTWTPVNIYFLKDGLSFAVQGEEIEDSNGVDIYPFLVWNLRFENTNPNVQIGGANGNASVVSYLHGTDPAQWQIHPQEFATLNYRDIYPNIDLNYYGNGNSLKYDYVLRPGANIQSIVGGFEGIDHLTLNGQGELEVKTIWETHKQNTPVAWQMINGVKQSVQVDYVVINDSTFGFSAPNGYNANYDLVIDPLFTFVFGSYTRAIGASNNINYCFGNAMDAAGNVYLTGMVDETYPITPGAYMSSGTIVPEIFVSKFSADGSTLLYSTYISGSSREMGLAIAVDAQNRAYITGYGEANWTGSNTYPTTANAFQQSIYPSAGSNAFITVLNPTGTSLVYSSWLGGSNTDLGYGIAIDNAGMAYITGCTNSNGNTFPTKGTSNAAQQTAQGYNDAFVAKFDITKSGAASLIYSVRIGGGGDDYGRSIAVNSAGNAFITGKFQDIMSPAFPTTTGAYKTTYDGGGDNAMAFAMKLSANTPITYDYSTYLGPGWGNAIAVDPSAGEAYVAGSTRTFTYPTTAGVIQPVHGQDALNNPNGDAFVTKLNASGSALAYSTFLGGENADAGTGIAVNSAGEVYVSGQASVDFPISSGAIQPNHATGGADVDFFVAHLNATASAYACGGATYVGGNNSDYGSSMYDYASPKVSILNHGGANDTITVSGTTHSTNFPTSSTAYSPNKLNGGADQPVFFKLTSACGVQPIPLQANATSTNAGCANTCDGTATASVQTGTAPYSYHWDNGATSAAIANLCAGTYNVTISDASNNSVTASVTITSIGAPSATISSNKLVMCANDSSEICVQPANLNYLWNNGATGACVSARLAGNYYVIVTDNNGCTAESNHLSLVVHPLPPVAISVNGDTLQAYDAVTYQWFLDGTAINGATTGTYIANQSGSYTVLITDTNGCEAVSNPIVLTGIDAISDELSLRVYPNPLDSRILHVESSAALIGAEVQIFDAHGSLVHQSRVVHHQSEIALDVPSGVYLLRVSTGERMLTKRIVRL